MRDSPPRCVRYVKNNARDRSHKKLSSPIYSLVSELRGFEKKVSAITSAPMKQAKSRLNGMARLCHFLQQKPVSLCTRSARSTELNYNIFFSQQFQNQLSHLGCHK